MYWARNKLLACVAGVMCVQFSIVLNVVTYCRYEKVFSCSHFTFHFGL